MLCFLVGMLRVKLTQRILTIGWNSMSLGQTERWLRKKKLSEGWVYSALSVLAFLAGCLVLFLTFWFTYAIIFWGWRGVSALWELSFGHKLHMTHNVRLVVSGIFVVLLFIQHLRTSPWHWGEYPKRDYESNGFIQMHAGITGAYAAFLAYPGASANMIADILLSGPRLVCGSYSIWKHGAKLRHMNGADCAQLLDWLTTQNAPVPYDDLRSAGWEEPLEQLRSVEGVVFLQKGVTLSDEFKFELASLKGS